MFKKIHSKKGFTLAELLIVVAIIAVLVAISIPVFSTQLEKARDATTVANLRSAYAEAAVQILDPDSTGTSATINGVKIESTDDNYGSGEADLPFTISGTKLAKGTAKVTFTFNEAAGTCTASMAAG